MDGRNASLGPVHTQTTSLSLQLNLTFEKEPHQCHPPPSLHIFEVLPPFLWPTLPELLHLEEVAAQRKHPEFPSEAEKHPLQRERGALEEDLGPSPEETKRRKIKGR